MREKSVMVVGLGFIGNYALEFLARSRGIDRIVACDVAESGRGKTNNAMLGAAAMGFFPEMEFIQLDLNDEDNAVEVLNRVQPQVILSTVTLQSYWVISQMPPEIFKRLKLESGYGPWVPMHVTLNYKLMKAIKAAGIETHVVTAAFPDATNAVLGKVGLAPTVGLGNLDNFTIGVKKLVAKKMDVPLAAVSVYLIGHHALRTAIKNADSVEIPPFLARIFVEGKDVSDEFDHKQLLLDEVEFVKGWRNDSKVATSGVKNVLGIIRNSGELTHSPGPNGLVGGYPIRLSRKGAEVVLPPGITLEEAVKVNEDSQVYDGIERIEDDGTLVLTDRAVQAMKEVLGFDRKRIKIDEQEESAMELRSRYQEAVKKYTA